MEKSEKVKRKLSKAKSVVVVFSWFAFEIHSGCEKSAKIWR